MNRLQRKENEVKEGGVQTTEGRGKEEDSRGTGQRRRERAIIFSGVKMILLPLITAIVLILCCDCLKRFCPLFIKPTLAISDTASIPIMSASNQPV